MINLIQAKNLYEDIISLSQHISTMDFEDNMFGGQLKNFSFIPSELENNFSQMLNQNVEIQPDTGFFRKSNNIIHIEPFYQHAQWLCIVAMEDITFSIYEQEYIKTVFDVEDNLDNFIFNTDPSKWINITTIKLNTNDYILIRPWLWHSVDGLIQLFLLNQKNIGVKNGE
jgi:hypothetical protein